jgi:hypothetical protein
MSNNLRSEESGNSELHTSGEPLDSTKQENYTCKPAQNLNTAKGNPERLLKGSQKHSAKTRPEFQNRKQVRPKHNVTECVWYYGCCCGCGFKKNIL